VSSGKRTQDDCEIVAQVPETLLTGANWRPAQYCHREEPMLTQVKLYGVYIVPKVDVQLSGSFRSVPGTDINANFVASNAYLAANSTLRRALSGGAANMTVQLLEPNSRYNERRNELDLRFGKVLRAGRHRSVLSVDLYNALNVNPIIAVNQAFASWLRPTEILNARVVKFSVQYDF
jgi:hypothetical protein